MVPSVAAPGGGVRRARQASTVPARPYRPATVSTRRGNRETLIHLDGGPGPREDTRR